VATCWEIAIKAGLKKLDLGEPASTFLPRELAANNFDLLEIQLRHAALVETLPPHHKDPFDRLLIAQPSCEGFSIIAMDAIFDRYGVSRLW
jgi:PIN domain nuclease of toxin-antitoxin system